MVGNTVGIFLNGSSANAFVALAPYSVPINRTIEGTSKVFGRMIICLIQRDLVYMNLEG